MDSPYLISGIPIPSTSRFWATSVFSYSIKWHKKFWHQNIFKRATSQRVCYKAESIIQTLEARKQKAEFFVFAFSGSTIRSPFSSSRHRYLPVVMWRTLKDWPHFMWLPLHLCTLRLNISSKGEKHYFCLSRICCIKIAPTRCEEAPVSREIWRGCTRLHLHSVHFWNFMQNMKRLIVV